MRKIRFSLLWALLLAAAAVSCGILKPKETKTADRTVIIVSLDGFRWDYPTIYSSPNIDAIAQNGVAAAMYPSYPASTFPNHYAIATGLVPDHNGLVNNSFWAPDMNGFYSISGKNKSVPGYFLGEPIWLTAQRQGLKSGIVYWVGSDVAVQDKYPTYWRKYGESPMLTYEERVDEALNFLNLPDKDRPRLIMLYFDEPDHSGHAYGPMSPQVRDAVKRVDDMIGRLRNGIAQSRLASGIDLIVLADHGMTEISPERFVNLYDYIDKDWCEIVMTGTPTSIFTKPGYQDKVYNALKDVEHIQTWKKGEVPEELNYGTSVRLGDIIVAPDLGWQVGEKPRTYTGAHGYSPFDTDMQALFRAEGPDFKSGETVKSFRNVSVYPLVCHLLGILPAPCDGTLEEVKHLLK